MSKIILGIDVGKRELAVTCLKDGKFTDKSVENNLNGFKKIVNFVKAKHSEVEVYLESTGRYGESVTDFLSDEGFVVKVINPAQISAFAKAKLARHKTDKVDARIIAEYGATFGGRTYSKIKENIDVSRSKELKSKTEVTREG